MIRKINEEFCPCRLACQLGSDTGRGFEMDGKEGVIEGSGGEGRIVMLGKGKEKWVEVRDLNSCKLLGWLYLVFRSGFEES